MLDALNPTTARALRHPAALTRQVEAITAASSYAGGMLSVDASPADRAAHLALGAHQSLTVARDYLRHLLRPTRRKDAAGLAYAYAADYRHFRRQARGGIRGAARQIADAQALLAERVAI